MTAEELRTTKEGEWTYQNRHYAFAIDKVWKGTPVNGIILTTALNSASCGVHFTVGEEYTPRMTMEMENLERVSAILW